MNKIKIYLCIETGGKYNYHSVLKWSICKCWYTKDARVRPRRNWSTTPYISALGIRRGEWTPDSMVQ